MRTIKSECVWLSDINAFRRWGGEDRSEIICGFLFFLSSFLFFFSCVEGRQAGTVV